MAGVSEALFGATVNTVYIILATPVKNLEVYIYEVISESFFSKNIPSHSFRRVYSSFK